MLFSLCFILFLFPIIGVDGKEQRESSCHEGEIRYDFYLNLMHQYVHSLELNTVEDAIPFYLFLIVFN
jgi:hypothetical protein